MNIIEDEIIFLKTTKNVKIDVIKERSKCPAVKLADILRETVIDLAIFWANSIKGKNKLNIIGTSQVILLLKTLKNSKWIKIKEMERHKTKESLIICNCEQENNQNLD